jgi:hypothetical protein
MTKASIASTCGPTDRQGTPLPPPSSSLHVCGLPALSRIDEQEEGKEGGDKGGQIGKESRSLGVEEMRMK